MVDASGFRAAARPGLALRARVFRKNMLRYDDLSRKNKNFDFLYNFFAITDSLPSSVGGKWAAVRPICRFFRASIRVLTLLTIRNRKEVAISGVFLFLGTRIGPMLVSRRGVPGAAPLWTVLGSVFAPLVSGFFTCRICGRSCPHSIAAPAVLRYHDRNCFKRALKCILRSKQAGKRHPA